MSSSVEYERMLDMEGSSCEVYFKPVKQVYKRKKVKNKILKDVNDKLCGNASCEGNQRDGNLCSCDENTENLNETNNQNPEANLSYEKYKSDKSKKGSKIKSFFKKAKQNLKFDIVSAQVAIIFVLVIAILLTNIFWEDSGMNVMLKNVFGAGDNAENAKEYDDFTVNAPETISKIDIEDGVMAFTVSGSVYAPCEGTIAEFVKVEDGTYSVKIKHSDSFSTSIEGLDYAYYFVGENVYKSTPVGYSNGKKVHIRFLSNGETIKNYTITDGMVVWQV